MFTRRQKRAPTHVVRTLLGPVARAHARAFWANIQVCVCVCAVWWDNIARGKRACDHDEAGKSSASFSVVSVSWENSRTIVENSQTIVENSQTIVENSRTIVENSRTIVKNSRTIVENSQY